jgi:phosphonate transport system permease protein
MTAATARFDDILAAARRHSAHRVRLILAVGAVASASLWLTGFFDLTRFIEARPAIGQLASEMVPPNFARWQSWLRPPDGHARHVDRRHCTGHLHLAAACPARSTEYDRWTDQYRITRTVLGGVPVGTGNHLGILFVAAVGFGALPGVLALALHSVGMVGSSTLKQ